jgi:hypothetical protein
MSKKTVRLVVSNNTNGSDKVEIGEAEIEQIPNGDMIVNMTITDPEVAELLGGKQIKGIIPKGKSSPSLEWIDEEK